MYDFVTGLMTYQIGDLFVEDYVLALIVFAATFLLLRFFELVIVHRLKKISDKTRIEIDDVLIDILQDIGWPLYAVVALYAGLHVIEVPEMAMKIAGHAAVIIATFYAVKAGAHVVDYVARRMARKRQAENAEADTALIMVLAKVTKGLLWVIAMLLVLSNVGYDVTTLLAGLGVGGIAVAFALQNVLTDIFASFSIYFDKPFEVGDFIVIGQDKGTVKHIGIKSTRLQTLQGEELVMSNQELTTARVHNYKRMEKRRITFSFGVTYDTPVAIVEKIPGMVAKIVDAQELANIDRVHFTEFGDSALLFEVVYFMTVSDYTAYRDTQQRINLEIMRAFEKEKIDFAFPTQTIYLHKE